MYFIMCDMDESGTLNRNELGAYFKMMETEDMSKKQIRQYLMNVWDVDDD